MGRTLIIITLVLCLTGCNLRSSYENKSISINSVDLSLENYSGKWYSEDYSREIDDEGNSVDYGTQMILKMEEKQIEILCISKPPANRVAYINSWIVLEDDFKGTFTFNDDGWGNKGKGTILFKKNKIIVEIDIENLSNDNWRMFTGQKMFIRNEQ